ncbi:sugar efflux transporter for intercellular exchange-domain-containing protein [Gorgonomyces haynaldii]|nr:sugar efflux transporter for intercellular exchange-domain-containing protein [Gorgonomyces haynaldii]
MLFECIGSCQIIFGTVFPLIANITGYILAIVPLKGVLQVLKDQKIGQLNALPFCFLFLNASAWMLYALILKDWWIVAANIPTLPLALFYTLQCLLFESPTKQQQTIYLLIGLLSYLMISAAISLVGLSLEAGKLYLGINCVIILLLFYASPLSTIKQVIKSKDSASINPWLGIAQLLCSFSWTVYGILLEDYFIVGPNFTGVVFSIMQLFLYVTYRHKSTIDEL